MVGGGGRHSNHRAQAHSRAGCNAKPELPAHLAGAVWAPLGGQHRLQPSLGHLPVSGEQRRPETRRSGPAAAGAQRRPRTQIQARAGHVLGAPTPKERTDEGVSAGVRGSQGDRRGQRAGVRVAVTTPSAWSPCVGPPGVGGTGPARGWPGPGSAGVPVGEPPAVLMRVGPGLAAPGPLLPLSRGDNGRSDNASASSGQNQDGRAGGPARPAPAGRLRRPPGSGRGGARSAPCGRRRATPRPGPRSAGARLAADSAGSQAPDGGAPGAGPDQSGEAPGAEVAEGTAGGRGRHSGVSSCSSACGGAWHDGGSDDSLSSAGRRRARGRWNERRLCTRRAAADRACAPGGPRRSGPAPGASPSSGAGPAPGSRSGAGFWVVGGAGGALGGAGGGAGAGAGGAWGGTRECFSAAGGTSCGDDRPVSGVSEPVSHVCGLGWGAVGLLLGAFGQLEGIH